MTNPAFIVAPGGDLGPFQDEATAADWARSMGYDPDRFEIVTPTVLPQYPLLSKALPVWRNCVHIEDPTDRRMAAIGALIDAGAVFGATINPDDAHDAIEAAAELDQIMEPDRRLMSNDDLARLLLREHNGNLVATIGAFLKYKKVGMSEAKRIIKAVGAHRHRRNKQLQPS